AVEPAYAVRAPQRVAGGDYLGISLGVKPAAAGFELAAQLAIVVDLTVEYEHAGFAVVRVVQRLIGALVEVDYRKPGMRQTDASTSRPESLRVGSAVAERAGEIAQQ